MHPYMRESIAPIIEGDYPESVKRMVIIHAVKPWIDGYMFTIIRPLRRGLEDYLGRAVSKVKDEPITFYLPSTTWWLAHASTAHPPDGSGCDVDAHTDFLTVDGVNAKFEYMYAFTHDVVTYIGVLGRKDFEIECEWLADHALHW